MYDTLDFGVCKFVIIRNRIYIISPLSHPSSFFETLFLSVIIIWDCFLWFNRSYFMVSNGRLLLNMPSGDCSILLLWLIMMIFVFWKNMQCKQDMVTWELSFMIFQPQGTLIAPCLSPCHHDFLCYVWFLLSVLCLID